jgi:spore maturation protein CgeB
MKIVLIGYCHLADGFRGGANALHRKGHEIFFFPYYCYIMDNRSDAEIDLLSLIEQNSIEVCLWWCNAVNSSCCRLVMEHLQQKHILHLFYNFDPFLYNYEKYNCFFWKPLIKNKEEVYSCMHHIFTCFEQEIQHFSNAPIDYLPPGFDPSISFYEEDKKYECDISIVCTTLYDDFTEHPKEAVSLARWEIVHMLYTHRHLYHFHIYGPEKFGVLFPDCYQGFVSYEEAQKVFSNSKINLSIHTLTKELHRPYTPYEYFSERVPQVLGCKGLLATNSFLHTHLKPNRDYIYLDGNENWFKQLLHIINHSNEYDWIRQNGYDRAMERYTWNHWANTMDLKMKSLCSAGWN